MFERLIRAILPPILYTALLLASDIILSSLLPESIPYAAPATLLAAAAAIPLFLWMFRRDRACKSMYGSDGREKEKKNEDRKRRMAQAVLFLLSGALYSLAGDQLMKMLGLYGMFSNETQEALLQASPLILILGPGLLVPAAEELCHRGLAYKRLRTLFSFPSAALLEAILFAVGHGNVLQMVYAFPGALLMTWIYEKWDFLLFPICFHIGANMISVLAALLMQ